MTTTDAPAKRVYAKVDADSVPVIEHWVTLPDAAIEMGLSRQQAYNLAAAGRFKTLRRLSARGKAQFILQRSELTKIVTDA
jgi:hypothetical protein